MLNYHQSVELMLTMLTLWMGNSFPLLIISGTKSPQLTMSMSQILDLSIRHAPPALQFELCQTFIIICL